MGILERLGTSGPALGAVVGLQAVIAVLRRRGVFGGLVDNSPLLLMAGPEVLEDHLRRARISREELFGQLRSAGIHRLEQVTAVVLETTGDLSVLTGGSAVDPVLLAGVRGGERLR